MLSHPKNFVLSNWYVDKGKTPVVIEGKARIGRIWSRYIWLKFMHRNKVLAPHTLNKLNQNHFKSLCTRILNEANAPKLPWIVMNNNQDCRALQLRAFRLRSATRQCCPIHGAGGNDKTVSLNVDGLLNFPVLTVPKLHRINSFTFQTQLLSSR